MPGNTIERIEMKGILSLVLSLIILLMASGLATAQLEEYSGFPKNVGAAIQADIVVTDLDNNTLNDIIVLPDNRRVYIYRPDGTMRWDRTAGLNLSDYARMPAVLDINGDDRKEIIMYGNPGHCCAHLYIWDSQGNLTKDIPIGSSIILSPPQVADIGEKIILVGASQGTPAPASGATGIYAFNSSGGQLWYSPVGPVNRTASIAVGNLDDEAGDEAAAIVYNDRAYRLTVLKLNSAGTTTLWTKDSTRRISGVVIDDINNDGKNEVIIGSGNGVYVWDRDGVLLWSNGAPVVTHSSPAVADIDGDGIKEVVIGSDQQKRLFAFRNGNLMQGFPVPTEQSVWSRPALADINGDGKLEIIAGDFAGYLYGWDYKGDALDGFPIQPTTGAFMSGPVVTDLTGNGSLQIIAGSDDGNIYAFTYSNRQRDTAPPVTTDNADGQWHNSGVTVTLTAQDAGSGVAATYYTTDGSNPTTGSASGSTITLTGDGIYTIKYFSVDNEGNAESIKTAANQVMIDTAPPAISGAPSVPPNPNGWHRADVTVNFIASDALSGIKTAPGEIVVSSEGTSLSVTGFATDNAGNSANFTVSGINIDKTPPVITGAALTSPNGNGWYSSDVVINFSATDTLSGIDTLTPDTAISAEGASLSAAGTATDKAGNSASFTVTGINIDRAPPATEISLTGTAGSNNWYISTVNATLRATDDVSGVSATYYSIDGGEYSSGTSFSVPGEGRHNISYYSVDSAGNSGVTEEQVINIDWTSPLTVDDADGAWHNSNVTVTLTASDNVSGLNSTYYRIMSGSMTWFEKLLYWLASSLGLAGESSRGETIDITDEGIFNIYYYSTDNAGNTEPEKMSGQVKLDRTLPVITVDVPQNRIYLHSDIITPAFSVQDTLSGIRSVNATLDGSRTISSGHGLDMLELGFGEHSFYIDALDNAGNANSRTVTFGVVATIDSLIALNSRAASNGWINNSFTNSLDAKLDSAKKSIDSGQNATARNVLEAYINDIQAQSGKGITTEGADILVSEARYVIDHLIVVNSAKSAQNANK